MTGLFPALRCRRCGGVRMILSSERAARRVMVALPERELRFARVPAAEARTAGCRHGGFYKEESQ